MKSMLRVVSLVVLSFAAASAFSTDAPSSMRHGTTVQAASPSGSTAPAVLVKCTNPRECSVG